jgi:hypothetical protein
MTTENDHALELEFECQCCHRQFRKPITTNPKIVKCKNCKGSLITYRKVRADVAPADHDAESGQLFT